MVHKGVATKSSKYIRAALSNDWKEARERRITLEDTAVATFEDYLHWLYTGQVTLPEHNQHVRLVDLYLLGDYLHDSLFCVEVLNKMVEARYHGQRTFPTSAAVKCAWEATPASSPIRKVIRELWTSSNIDLAFKEFTKNSEYPRDFVLDILSELVKSRPHLKSESISMKSQPVVEQLCSEHVSILQLQEAVGKQKW